MTSDHMTMQSCDTDCTVPAPAVQRTPGSSSLDSAAQVRLSMPVFPFYYILTLDSAAKRASWNVSLGHAIECIRVDVERVPLGIKKVLCHVDRLGSSDGEGDVARAEPGLEHDVWLKN